MEAKFIVSPRILEHLGVAAYTSLSRCLAELCSNCYDADAENVWITLPEKFDNNSKIIISDDGVGMTANDIKEKYLFIGYNRRESGDNISKKKRPIIGNKGIGKLAGFGIANSIDITSRRNFIESNLTLEKKIFDDFLTLNDCSLEISSNQVIGDVKGTTLILRNLSTSLKPISPSKLRQYLYRVLPVIPDFSVYVNDEVCSAEEIPGDKFTFSHEFKDVGKITGFYKITNSRQSSPGFVIRVRNRVVTEPSLFGLEKRSHFSFSTEKLIGEVNADFLDEYINTSRDDFLAEVEEVQNLNTYLHDYFKEVIDELEKTAEGRRTEQIIIKNDVQKKLEKLPPHIRVKARSVITGVISKLKSASDEEVNELVDWIIKYFESNVLRELMNSIMTADINDIGRLSDLIKDWGLRQINNVTEIIKEQIDIIKKLEELINSDQSLEIELHKLIEKNLWLVREGLELWSSDKPLKSILEHKFDKIYADNINNRPDLICRSKEDGNEAIIMEFKKPSVKIIMVHVAQALEYKGIIQNQRPQLKKLNTYIVGRQYDPVVLASKTELEKSGIYLWSFGEILQKSRVRFESILEILNS